jgi:hypothetical protein
LQYGRGNEVNHPPIDGNKRKLKEFIENVGVAFELAHPSKHEILLKFVRTKITGYAR